jgi:hypothetical protein
MMWTPITRKLNSKATWKSHIGLDEEGLIRQHYVKVLARSHRMQKSWREPTGDVAVAPMSHSREFSGPAVKKGNHVRQSHSKGF